MRCFRVDGLLFNSDAVLVDSVADVVSPAAHDDAARALTAMVFTSAAQAPVIAGAGQLLNSTPPHQWAVVTSGPREMVLKRLISAGLPHPSSLISVEDVRCGLPAPDPYLAGAQRLTLDPEHCAVFEDSPMGVKAARAAGVKVVIGIGQATVGHEVTISIPDLAGISFDGRSLVVSGDHLA